MTSQVAFATQRYAEAYARLVAARVLWLPSINSGVGWNNHAGPVQASDGIVSQAVAYRRREVAIRIAVGAAPRAIVATVTRRVLLMGIAGTVAGILAAFALSRTLEVILYGVHSRDLLSFSVACAALLGVTAIAAFIPARRAIRVDPVTVLRAD